MKPPKMDPRQNLPPETEAVALAAYPKRRPLLPQIGVGVSSRGPRVRGPQYGASLYPNPLLHMDLPLLVWMTQLVHQRKVNFQISPSLNLFICTYQRFFYWSFMTYFWLPTSDLILRVHSFNYLYVHTKILLFVFL